MTRLLSMSNKQQYWNYINEAVQSLKRGEVIAFPTETVYGLGANADDEDAILRLYEIKQRPMGKKLTVFISKIDETEKYVDHIPPDAQKLMNMFWPGPLTLVMKSKDLEDIGLRIPKYRVIYDLLSLSQIPIAAPSANISGENSLTDAGSVFDVFKDKIDIVLDGGISPIGIASTVVKVNDQGVEILRHGAITDEQIHECLK